MLRTPVNASRKIRKVSKESSTPRRVHSICHQESIWCQNVLINKILKKVEDDFKILKLSAQHYRFGYTLRQNGRSLLVGLDGHHQSMFGLLCHE